MVERHGSEEGRRAFGFIASALDEIAPFHVRFIAFDTDLEAPLPAVPEAELRVTSRTVEAALGDARHLVSSRGSTSGVDRAHTAFHAYLKVLCDDAQIEYAEDADVTRLFRLLRDGHPSLQAEGARSEDITRVLRALATVVNVLNPVRNRATLVHPNTELLEPPEADLVLNCIHTLLHYLNEKLR